MARRLDIQDQDFEVAFQDLMSLKRETSVDVNATVAQIIQDVRDNGDASVLSLTKKFDKLDLAVDQLAFSPAEIAAAKGKCSAQELSALKVAADRIRVYHEKQIPTDKSWIDEQGVSLGWRWTAVEAVGLYVPGGLATYPSSVLMNAIPAQVAGAQRLVMVVPTPNGIINPLVLAAAELAGVTEIYRIGGAQAVAALAYGTETIAPVDKIVGPGNAYVAAAKKQVFGQVGIDSIAGPSEILVVADGDNRADWIAADLLSQAEHDPSAQSILITDDPAFADKVAQEVETQLTASPREDIARAAWGDNSAIITTPTLEAALPVINRLAAEHLELAIAEPEAMLPKIRHAGAIFLGRHTPEAIGDYVAGPDHVLPTSRAARYTSGLSVMDFLKRTSLIGCTPEALANIGPAAVTLAESEGLHSHAESISIRLRK